MFYKIILLGLPYTQRTVHPLSNGVIVFLPQFGLAELLSLYNPHRPRA